MNCNVYAIVAHSWESCFLVMCHLRRIELRFANLSNLRNVIYKSGGLLCVSQEVGTHIRKYRNDSVVPLVGVSPAVRAELITKTVQELKKLCPKVVIVANVVHYCH